MPQSKQAESKPDPAGIRTYSLDKRKESSDAAQSGNLMSPSTALRWPLAMR